MRCTCLVLEVESQPFSCLARPDMKGPALPPSQPVSPGPSAPADSAGSLPALLQAGAKFKGSECRLRA